MPGAVFDEEAGHGGAEACRRAEALALSVSPRLNSQNPGLFCQLLFDDSCQALKLTQAIFALNHGARLRATFYRTFARNAFI